MKNQRKFLMYLFTLLGVFALDWIAITKGVGVPFDGMTISGLFAFAVAGTTAEHFAKKREGVDANGG